MAATFPQQPTPLGFQVPHEIDALHARLGAEPLPNHRDARELLLGQRPVGLEDQLNGFA